MVMPYSDEEREQIMETSRDNLERLQDLRISEPVFTKEWQLPEPEPEPKPRKLDTNPNAHLEQQVQRLAQTLAEILPSLEVWMNNVNRSWAELKQRNEQLEKQLEEKIKSACPI